MRRILITIFLILLLANLVLAQPTITSYATDDEEHGNSEDSQGEESGEQAENSDSGEEKQTQSQILTQAQIQEVTQERNRLRIQNGECPENCTCEGNTMRFTHENGEEISITGEDSGETTIESGNVKASTQAALYQSEGKLYGNFSGEIKEISATPDAVQAEIQEQINGTLEDEEITLEEDGIYVYRAKERVRLFGLIQARVRVTAEVNSETGELTQIRTSWWAFLTSEDSEENSE